MKAEDLLNVMCQKGLIDSIYELEKIHRFAWFIEYIHKFSSNTIKNLWANLNIELIALGVTKSARLGSVGLDVFRIFLQTYNPCANAYYPYCGSSPCAYVCLFIHDCFSRRFCENG